MDLIGQLAGQLGVDPSQASALAGTVLGGVKTAVADQSGPEAASALDAQVPELADWQGKAAEVADANPVGGLLGGLAGAVGGEKAQQAAQVASLLKQFGVDGAQAAMVGPIVLGFLKDRMDPSWVDMALKAAPFLSGGDAPAGGGGAAAAAMGALGGMFGGGS